MNCGDVIFVMVLIFMIGCMGYCVCKIYDIVIAEQACRTLCVNEGLGFLKNNIDSCVCLDSDGFDVECKMNSDRTLLRCQE